MNHTLLPLVSWANSPKYHILIGTVTCHAGHNNMGFHLHFAGKGEPGSGMDKVALILT
jgi:hypothetical protein